MRDCCSWVEHVFGTQESPRFNPWVPSLKNQVVCDMKYLSARDPKESLLVIVYSTDPDRPMVLLLPSWSFS